MQRTDDGRHVSHNRYCSLPNERTAIEQQRAQKPVFVACVCVVVGGVCALGGGLTHLISPCVQKQKKQQLPDYVRTIRSPIVRSLARSLVDERA